MKRKSKEIKITQKEVINKEKSVYKLKMKKIPIIKNVIKPKINYLE